jgi:hypothetical protein
MFVYYDLAFETRTNLASVLVLTIHTASYIVIKLVKTRILLSLLRLLLRNLTTDGLILQRLTNLQ